MSSVENERDYRDAGSDDLLEAQAEQRRFDVDAAGHGERLDKLLVVHASEFSRSHLQSLIERELVTVDGAVSRTASRRLKAGQSVVVELQPTDECLAFTAEPMVLAVVFEDEHLIVIDKPAGLVVHPAPGNWRITAAHRCCRVRASCTGSTRTPRA